MQTTQIKSAEIECQVEVKPTDFDNALRIFNEALDALPLTKGQKLSLIAAGSSMVKAAKQFGPYDEL